MPNQTQRSETQRARGRPARISREQIVDAAFALGLDGLTMAAVAKYLGTSHQALYRWVTNRDELFDLVTDALVERLDIPAPESPEDWRTSLHAFAGQLGTLLLKLPGFAAVGLTRYRTSPPFLRLNERALNVLTDAGFDPPTAQRIFQTFGTALLGWLAREDAYRDTRQHPDQIAQTIPDSSDYPLVQATAINDLTSPTKDRYQFLIDTLLTGLPEPEGNKRPSATARHRAHPTKTRAPTT